MSLMSLTAVELGKKIKDKEAKKQESIRKIRCHYVKQLIDEFDYFSKKAEADTLLIEMNQREKEFDDEKSKIDGHGGLKDSITNILAEIPYKIFL